MPTRTHVSRPLFVAIALLGMSCLSTPALAQGVDIDSGTRANAATEGRAIPGRDARATMERNSEARARAEVENTNRTRMDTNADGIVDSRDSNLSSNRATTGIAAGTGTEDDVGGTIRADTAPR